MEANVFIMRHILIGVHQRRPLRGLMGSETRSLKNIIICVSLWFSSDRKCDGSGSGRLR